METVKIALLGLGPVGTGVYKVLKAQQEEIPHKVGAKIQLKKVLVRNTEKASRKLDDPSSSSRQNGRASWKILRSPLSWKSWAALNRQEDISWMRSTRGKSVVTANKDLLRPPPRKRADGRGRRDEVRSSL